MSVHVVIPYPRQNEGSSFVATAYFRSGDAASTPSSARYRIDCLTTQKQIRDWTSLTPASSISITVENTDNAIQDDYNDTETRQLMVEENTGTSQHRAVARWDIYNLYGVT
jgi:hypothetical protein